LWASAGTGEQGKLGEITEEHFDAALSLNARGTMFTVQKALPLFNDGGSIFMTGSNASLRGYPDWSVYAASKAVLPAARGVRRGGFGARVPAWCPQREESDTRTDRREGIVAGQGRWGLGRWGGWRSNPGPTDYESRKSGAGYWRLMLSRSHYSFLRKGFRVIRCWDRSAKIGAFVPALCPLVLAVCPLRARFAARFDGGSRPCRDTTVRHGSHQWC
jgi:hypothetical protein